MARDSDCPGSLQGHKYETSGDKMTCVRCPRITKYDPMLRKWIIIQK